MLLDPPEKKDRDVATSRSHGAGAAQPRARLWVIPSDDPAWVAQVYAVCHRCSMSGCVVPSRRGINNGSEGPWDRIVARWPLAEPNRDLLRRAAAASPELEVIMVIDHSRAGAEMQAELSDLDVIPLGLPDWKRAAGSGDPGWVPLALRPRHCRSRLAAAELDRLARLEVMEKQGVEIGRLHLEIQRWIADLENVSVAALEQSTRAAELSKRLADLNNSSL